MTLFTEDVFGVASQKVIESFNKRDEIESSFLSALRSHKQIVVYGSSKQGKTLLVRTHFRLDETITVELSPHMHLTDLYRAILRQAGVAIQLRYEEGRDIVVLLCHPSCVLYHLLFGLIFEFVLYYGT